LRVEYFYLESGPSNVAALDGLTPDVVQVDTEINIPSTRDPWDGLTQADKFGAVWSGGIWIVAPGAYTFSLRSDDGSVLYIEGQKIIDNDGRHGMKEITGELDLTAGAHTLSVKYIENGGGAGVIMKYSGPDTEGELIVVPSSVLITPEGSAPASVTTTTTTTTTSSVTTSSTKLQLSGQRGGLRVEYFYLESGPSNVAALDGLTPDVVQVDTEINIPSTRDPWDGLTQADKFGAVWSGGIWIVAPGAYTFSLRSDDGSVLYIEGQKIIDNDGRHGMKEITGELDLTAGAHTLSVKYIENGGGAGVIMKYSGPDTEGELIVVPSSVLITPEGYAPASVTTTTTTTTTTAENSLMRAISFNSADGCRYDAASADTSVLTMSFQALPTTLSSWRTVRNDNSWPAASVHFQFKDGKLKFGVKGNSPSGLFFNYAFEADTSYSIMVAYDKNSASVALYLDGALQETQTFNSAVDAKIRPGYLGCWDSNGNGNFQRQYEGSITDFRMKLELPTITSTPRSPFPPLKENSLSRAISFTSSDGCKEDAAEVTSDVIIFTFEVLPTDLKGWRAIRNDDQWVDGGIHLQFKDNKLEFSLKGARPTDTWFDYRFEDNTQYSIKVEYDKAAASVKLFLDGVLEETHTYGTPKTAHMMPGHVGCWNVASGGNTAFQRQYEGSITNLRVRTKSTSTTTTTTAPASSLISLMHMDGDAGCVRDAATVESDFLSMGFTALLRAWDGYRVVRNDDRWERGGVHLQFQGRRLRFGVKGSSPTNQQFDFDFKINTEYDIRVVYDKVASSVKLLVDDVLRETKYYGKAITAHLAPGYLGCWDASGAGDIQREYAGTITDFTIHTKPVLLRNAPGPVTLSSVSQHKHVPMANEDIIDN